MKILETDNYLQKIIANKLLGHNFANYVRLFKTILFFKLGIKYDPGTVLSVLIKKGDVVFDIGANIGQSACRYSKLVGSTGSVYSFEPVKKNFHLFKMMGKVLKFKNVYAFNSAVGDKSGTTRIKIPIIKNTNIEVGTRASLKYSKNEFKNATIRYENVAVKTIDELMEELHLNKIDLIKSDTEGNELNVLRGGYNTINKHKPNLILEINYNNKGLEIWYRLGYKPYYVENNTLVQADASTRVEGDVILIHNEKTHLFKQIIFKKGV